MEDEFASCRAIGLSRDRHLDGGGGGDDLAAQYPAYRPILNRHVLPFGAPWMKPSQPLLGGLSLQLGMEVISSDCPGSGVHLDQLTSAVINVHPFVYRLKCAGKQLSLRVERPVELPALGHITAGHDGAGATIHANRPKTDLDRELCPIGTSTE